MYYIISIMVLILGVIVLTSNQLSNNRGLRVDLTDNSIYIFVGIVFISYSIYILYIKHKCSKSDEENKPPAYSICPICKETFHYDELDNGKCKYCEDVDTIDIEEYYKNNPEEKNE